MSRFRYSLQLGWFLYSGDNDDRIVATTGSQAPYLAPDSIPIAPQYLEGGTNASWVLGIAKSTLPNPPDRLEFLRKGLLYPYSKTAAIYKCPGDRTQNYRSMSMNAWMNPVSTEGKLNATYTIFRKQSNIRNPVETWVTIDENEAKINDGWFLVRPEATGTWVDQDIPASYHNNSGGLSYADGHAQTKKWKDSKILKNSPLNAPDSFDLVWLAERTTVKR